MKQIILVAASLIAGLAGGFLGERLAHVREGGSPERVVRARAFELVDGAGRPISYWGFDRRGNAALSFGGQWDSVHHVDRIGDLTDPRNQGAAFGIVGGSPTLQFNGADGAIRLNMGLSCFEKPLLWMGDETGKRLALGVEYSDTPSAEDNDWHLIFEPNRAWIGMYVARDGTGKYVQGGMSVNTGKVKYP